jgi:hypothetical protein
MMPRTSQLALLGVRVRVRPEAALSTLLVGGLTYLLARALPQSQRISLALSSAVLWPTSGLTHAAGHVISAQQVAAPMDEVRLGILAGTLYRDNDVTPRQHIGRAIGGPLASGAVALLWWLAWRSLGTTPLGRVAQAACLQNAFLALGSLLPLPWVDGGVIVANIRKL